MIYSTQVKPIMYVYRHTSLQLYDYYSSLQLYEDLPSGELRLSTTTSGTADGCPSGSRAMCLFTTSV